MEDEDRSRHQERCLRVAKADYKNQPFHIRYTAKFYKLFDIIQHEIPPGPKFVNFNYLVLGQKISIIIWCLYLMRAYNNYTMGAFVYLYLHGTHALIWIFKESINPEQAFRRNLTLVSAILTTTLVLLPYNIPAYILISDKYNRPSNIRIGICLLFHLFGLYLNHGSDIQKYFVLKQNKHYVISDGFWRYTRNPNYIGMMMIYASFIYLVNRRHVYYIIFSIWTLVFIPRMVMKDVSLASKHGWEKYQKHSWMFFPRVFNRRYENFMWVCAVLFLYFLTTIKYETGRKNNITIEIEDGFMKSVVLGTFKSLTGMDSVKNTVFGILEHINIQ